MAHGYSPTPLPPASTRASLHRDQQTMHANGPLTRATHGPVLLLLLRNAPPSLHSSSHDPPISMRTSRVLDNQHMFHRRFTTACIPAVATARVDAHGCERQEIVRGKVALSSAQMRHERREELHFEDAACTAARTWRRGARKMASGVDAVDEQGSAFAGVPAPPMIRCRGVSRDLC